MAMAKERVFRQSSTKMIARLTPRRVVRRVKRFLHERRNYINVPVKGFKESKYLRLNPDVSKRLKKGDFSSGFEHYILQGYSQRRPGIPSEVNAAVQSILDNGSLVAVPPDGLRKRVHGEADLSSFERVGKLAALNLYCAINPILKRRKNIRVLDFGCGCGRVASYFHRLSGNSVLFGSDIDKEAISWCQRNLSEIGEFVENKHHPPLPFKDKFFDLVYAVSVFTHLPEDMQFVWLEELARVTKPGGYLLLSKHGEELLKKAPKVIREQFKAKGFYYAVGTGTDGLPEFYQTSFHTNEYIVNYWSKIFKIVTIIEYGIAKHQDLVICKRSR